MSSNKTSAAVSQLFDSSSLKPAVSYLVISDIHLHHRRTETEHICESLNIYFDDYTEKSKFKDLNIIFIAGDLLDRLMDASGDDIHHITFFLKKLLKFCERFKIKLRLLRGTPSHDWEQNRLANMVYNLIEADVDFKVVEVLSIEHLNDLQLDILYVPDEWSLTCSDTLTQVKTLLAEKGLERVDIAIMHGAFGYQMAGVPGNHDVHDEAEYLNIVRYFINIGHYHVFTSYERIIGQGSFDRIGHGEEGPKGGTVQHIRTGADHFDFVENHNAKVYKTINFTDETVEEAFKKIKHVISKLPEGSFIRLRAPRSHGILAAINEVQRTFSLNQFTKLAVEDESERKAAKENVITAGAYIPISITPENIVDITLRGVNEKLKLGDDEVLRLQSLLTEISV